jgi:hypothetical protein
MAGYTLYQNDSRVVVVTDNRGKGNRKTGRMLQVWIMVKDTDPVAAIRIGADSIVCGNCRHGGKFGARTCYVRMDTAPLAVWRAWKRGRYPFLPKANYPAVFTDRIVRWGAW